MSLQVDIKKRLNNFTLEVSFDTEKNWCGILGASGCGKSMTLKMIAGIETPDQGKIVLKDRVLFDSEKKINLPPQKRNIGYLFQNYALFPNMTCEENIRCGLKDGNENLLKSLITMLELEELRDSYPVRISGGQQQRVALARCMAGKPDAILLDEPFSALDEFLKEKLQQDVKDVLSTYPGEVLLVSHSRDEVYRFCDKIAILEQGKVVSEGNTKDVFDNPIHVAAARLSGCKNISPAHKTGEYEIFADDWKAKLKTDKKVPDDIKYVGIRAHDIVPSKDEKDDNLVKVSLKESRDNLFEANIMFDCGDGNLWWKIAKSDWRDNHLNSIPNEMTLPSNKLLLLKT